MLTVAPLEAQGEAPVVVAVELGPVREEELLHCGRSFFGEDRDGLALATARAGNMDIPAKKLRAVGLALVDDDLAPTGCCNP
jgi:hypothetical protein